MSPDDPLPVNSREPSEKVVKFGLKKVLQIVEINNWRISTVVAKMAPTLSACKIVILPLPLSEGTFHAGLGTLSYLPLDIRKRVWKELFSDTTIRLSSNRPARVRSFRDCHLGEPITVNLLSLSTRLPIS